MIARTGIRRGLRNGAGGASILLVAVVTAACGGGSPPPPAPTTAAAADGRPALPPQTATFCTSAVDLSGVLADGPDLDDPPGPPEAVEAAFDDFAARLEPPLKAMEQVTPPAVQQDVATIARQARYAVATRDEAPLDTPEDNAAEARLRTFMISECGFEQVRVTAVEHQFEGIPPTLPTGTVAFTLANQGAQPHQLVVYRINEGVPQPFRDLVLLPDDQRRVVLTDVGGFTTNPGAAETEFLTLIPGKYGVACLVAEGSTPAADGTGPPHAALGMTAEFTVR